MRTQWTGCWWKKKARERGGRGWLRTGTGRFVAQRSAVKILLYVYRGEVQFDRLVFYCCGCKPLEPLYFWISWVILHMISERVGDKQASSADTTISDKGTSLSPWLVTLPTMMNLLSQLFSVVEHCSHSNRNWFHGLAGRLKLKEEVVRDTSTSGLVLGYHFHFNVHLPRWCFDKKSVCQIWTSITRGQHLACSASVKSLKSAQLLCQIGTVKVAPALLRAEITDWNLADSEVFYAQSTGTVISEREREREAGKLSSKSVVTATFCLLCF